MSQTCYEKGQLHYTITDTIGRIQELLTGDGEIVWRGKQRLWGLEEGINKELREENDGLAYKSSVTGHWLKWGPLPPNGNW